MSKELDKRLSAFGLNERDLTKTELVKAKKDLKDGTGGFLSSEEMISRSFRKKNGK